MEPVLDEYVDDQTTDTDGDVHTDTDRTDGEETATTPSQSRSSSIRPGQNQVQAQGSVGGVVGVQQQETVDVFDGYSFKGRHSVLIDSSDEDEEDEDEEDEDEEGSGSEMTGTSERTGTTGVGTGSSEADDSSVLGSIVTQDLVTKVEPEHEQESPVEDVEPKTPEARPVSVPSSAVDSVPEDISRLLADAKELEHKLEEGDVGPETPTEEKPKSRILPVLESKLPTGVTPTHAPLQQQQKPAKAANRSKRRERSGIPALDKDLPEDTEAGEDTEAAGGFLDDEDDDWDFIDAVDGEDRNGAKGTSLFARGVVDRYRLAVFRKASTPSRSTTQQSRSVSGTSKVSETTGPGPADGSPTQKRGRAALAFTRKGPRQFLQPKNTPTRNQTQSQSTQPPPSSFSYSAKKSRKSFGNSPNSNASTTISATASSSTAGLLTPSLSMGSSAMMSPSLKSRESATSVGAQSASSDQSVGGGGGVNGRVNGDVEQAGHDTVKANLPVAPVVEETNEKMKATKKLKKYKEGAEKVFSLFSGASSPRQHHAS